MEGDELDFLNFALSRRRRSEHIVVADVATTQTEQNLVADIQAEQIAVADTPVCRKRKFTRYTDDGRRVRTVKPEPPMSKELSMARAREALAKKRFAALKKVGLTVVQEVCNVVAQKSKLRISLGGLARQLQKQTRKKRSLATLDADCVQITCTVVLAPHTLQDMAYSQEVLTSTLRRMYGCGHTVVHRTIRATAMAELLLQEAMLNRIISDLEVGPRPDFCLCVPYHDGTSP